MNDVLMTNIFFMITAISSVIITILLSIALYFLIKILKKGREVTDLVSDETQKIIGDVETVRSSVKRHAGMVKGVATAAFVKKTVDTFLNNKQDKQDKE